ncbi:MAG: hypothetical protein B6242_09390 [Anaerolineaceae bacterium 4572_78]|nr:MAG: hypothetical protein B6242_09390 [Anaerolineaceae bacterium 4572_78]
MTYLKTGTILRDRYHIAGLIGTGGMGSVYLADDERISGRRCAIKEQVMDSDLLKTAQIQFQQEASILAQLDHPGLPQVSDYFSDEENGRDYLVMDYVPGQNLEQLVKKANHESKFLDEETVCDWLDQLCAILIYLHSRKPMVLHRDIKPANIKLTPDNRLKLVDFGIAKPFDADDPRTITGLQGLGSLPYTPLEQYIGHIGHTDDRTDLYALGATCHHLLTGQTPPSANAILTAMRLHPDERPKSVQVWYTTLRETVSTVSHDTLPITIANPTTYTTLANIFRENAVLLGIAFMLLVLALVITYGGYPPT